MIPSRLLFHPKPREQKYYSSFHGQEPVKDGTASVIDGNSPVLVVANNSQSLSSVNISNLFSLRKSRWKQKVTDYDFNVVTVWRYWSIGNLSLLENGLLPKRNESQPMESSLTGLHLEEPLKRDSLVGEAAFEDLHSS